MIASYVSVAMMNGTKHPEKLLPKLFMDVQCGWRKNNIEYACVGVLDGK